jgi:hypothetical protein
VSDYNNQLDIERMADDNLNQQINDFVDDSEISVWTLQRHNKELYAEIDDLRAQLAAMQRERDEARDERDVMYDTYRIERDRLAAAKLDARTAYARGLKDAAQAFEVRRAEIMAHADAELAKLGVKQG